MEMNILDISVRGMDLGENKGECKGMEVCYAGGF